MAKDSGVTWATDTFNPWVGCAKISEGCQHCYAEAYAERFPMWGNPWGSKPRYHPSSTWREPHAWNEQGGTRLVFCGSLCDVYEDLAELVEPRARLLETIRATRRLTWAFLTKRPQSIPLSTVLPNVWLGVTAETQARADERLPVLARHNAALRFVSCEPLLGPIDLRTHLPNVGWVIVGGESGPCARPMRDEWVRTIRHDCERAGVPLFFKQWGAMYVAGRSTRHCKLTIGKTVDLPVLDGATHGAFPDALLKVKEAEQLQLFV